VPHERTPPRGHALTPLLKSGSDCALEARQLAARQAKKRRAIGVEGVVEAALWF